MMSPNPDVINYSGQKMKLISRLYFICGIQDALYGAFRGIKKPIVPTIASFFFTCVLRVLWVFFIYPLSPSLTFLYLVWPVGWVLAIVTTLPIFIHYYNKLKKENNN